MLFASIITYISTVTLVRVSILLLYRRIFDIKYFRIVAAGLIVACIAWGISTSAANIFQCRNIPDAFRAEIVAASDGRCIDTKTLYYGALGTGFTLDLIILLLPFQQIYGLQLERRQKWELIGILSLGGLYDSCDPIQPFLSAQLISRQSLHRQHYTYSNSQQIGRIQPRL